MFRHESVKHVGVQITQKDCCDIYFYEIIVHLLVLIKNNKRYTVHVCKYCCVVLL
jgi:hypothetical protein